MTGPADHGVQQVIRSPGDVTEEHLMRLVVAILHSTVDRLSRAAAAGERCSPVTAAHIRELSRAIAGLTLDALRSWPAAGD